MKKITYFALFALSACSASRGRAPSSASRARTETSPTTSSPRSHKGAVPVGPGALASQGEGGVSDPHIRNYLLNENMRPQAAGLPLGVGDPAVVGAAAKTATPTVHKDTTYDDVKKLAAKVDKRGRGLTFDKPVTLYVQGKMLLVKGHVSFFADTGTISMVTGLQNKVTFQRGGQHVTFRSWISFSRKGRLTFGTGAQQVTFTVGKNKVTFKPTTPKGYSAKMFFYESGNIADIHIYDDHPITVGSKTYLFAHHCGCGGDLRFYEDGRFKGGFLAKDTVIAGRTYTKGALVEFSRRGNPLLMKVKRVGRKSASPWKAQKTQFTYFTDIKDYADKLDTLKRYYVLTFNDPVVLYVKGKRFKVKGTVYFYMETETVWSVNTLLQSDKVTVGGHTTTFRDAVNFAKSGAPVFGYPTVDLTFKVKSDTVTYKQSTGRKRANLRFYPSGKLMGLQIAASQNITVYGTKVAFAPRFNHWSHDLQFHENGNLKYGYLAADTTIGGTSFKKGVKVEFTSDGKLKTP